MPASLPFKPSHGVAQLELGEATTMKDDLRYNALRNADARSESSNTEVEDWDTEEGDVKLSRRRTLWKKVKAWKWLLDTGLLLIIVVLLVEERWRHSSKSPAFQLAGDITGFAPEFSQQIVTFKPDPVFAPENASEFWSRETQHAWLDIVPEGLGYVNVSNPSQYNNLPHPVHDYPNHTVFTTSVTHQLHCLYTIVEAYNILKIQTESTSPPAHTIKMPWHINHCFEYMRQAVMCAGDVALEGAATTFPAGEGGEDRGGSDGWDSRHVCKNYGEVKEYLESRTMNHWKWISSE
ncbi:hypothetical protein HBH98_071770 [Parastagonospora nodorum]|nr:hypothetical protein HBH53_020210 [Parastagonospora nodorum]KAH3999862.1 hypothetical protein HBI10_107140 [Parastagonospora nodorum]KAH4022396.1 hypothetical protein HBI13_102050 [Parastagonospora nodorum]KAH4051274.1 hypothetical protein HBH49_115480 [Parastagonospora nodorum]KAH4178689.1 hypothetical protein HBH43_027350 [Parastagonospora nodorum]